MSHLGHAAHAPAAQSGILVAVPPTVDCSLNQTSLAAQGRVQLCKRPSDSVALRLILQPVSPILILGAACPRVNTVLSLELGRELIRVDRLHIASDRVLHLDTVPGIFERDPLNAVSILTNHEGSCGGNRPWSSIRVHTARGRACGRRQLTSILGGWRWSPNGSRCGWPL